MSAINPIIQTPPRLNPDPFKEDAAQTSSPAAQTGFSQTLSNLGAKPARKSNSGKAPGSHNGGHNLPAPGNSSPQPMPAAGGSPPAKMNPAAATSPHTGGPDRVASTNASTVGITAGAGAASLPSNSPTATGAAAVSDHGPAEPFGQDAVALAATLAPTGAAGSSGPPTLPGETVSLANSATLGQPVLGSVPAQTAADSSPPVLGTLPADGDAATLGAQPAPAPEIAAGPAESGPRNGAPGQSAAARRAIDPTPAGASGLNAPGGTDPLSGIALPDAATAASPPPNPADTAALLLALQTNPRTASAAPDAQPAPANPPGNPMAGPLGLSALNAETATALPAAALAATSTAQLTPTILVAADKKPHTDSPGAANFAAASPGAEAALALNTPLAQAPDNALPSFKMNAALNSPEFSQNLANHVATMFDANLNSAKLQVSPPSLGPIEVRIAIQGDHAQVWMASHSALTRDALQEAAPKLRELLGSQGFAQVSVDISQRNFQERAPMAQAYERHDESGTTSSLAVGTSAALASRTPSGALDAYA